MGLGPALGVSRLAPMPSSFRTNATGRWPLSNDRAPAAVYLHRRHSDGTTDLIALEVDGDGYTAGSRGVARDFGVVRP
jgi:hypothetical protein